MKTLYTSYYDYAGHDAAAVGISSTWPVWFRRRWYLKVVPPDEWYDLLNRGEIDENEFALLYIEMLNSLDITPQQIVDELYDKSMLVTHAAPTAFCHRHVLAEWLERNAQVKVLELTPPATDVLVEECLQF